MRECTVIVPTWNMGRYLEPLFNSIVNSDFAERVEEIIFVCDKSNDNSESIIKRLAEQQIGRHPSVRLIEPTTREGLFKARYLGAMNARTKKIMFIDSRITLPAASANALARLMPLYPAIFVNLDIDTNKNIFCLYWRRSHARFFRSEEAVAKILMITSENFHATRVGGTCFYCSRDLFVEVSQKYLGQKIWSDDTYVLADMVAQEPFTLHPDVRVNWEPRDEPLVFLKHLYGRGPGLAQYHFFRHRGPLFYATLLGVLYLVLTLTCAFLFPPASVGLILFGLSAALGSTALIAHGWREFLRLAPLHAAVLAFYGTGAVRGAWVVWRRSRAKQV